MRVVISRIWRKLWIGVGMMDQFKVMEFKQLHFNSTTCGLKANFALELCVIVKSLSIQVIVYMSWWPLFLLDPRCVLRVHVCNIKGSVRTFFITPEGPMTNFATRRSFCSTQYIRLQCWCSVWEIPIHPDTLQELKLQGIKIRNIVVFSRYSQA